MSEKKFKVLSLDGGGIRGLFPAVILTEIERDLKNKGSEKWQIYQNVDLIFGTSTGGVLALALSLGIPAEEIKKLYFENAHSIFGKGKNLFFSLFGATHKRENLERLLIDIYKKYSNNEIPLLKDCKIPVGVSVYDLHKGCPSVLKSMYHKRFKRDPNLPLFKAALSTSSAPTYFDPYSSEDYEDLDGVNVEFKYKVDGGVWANNPSLIALVEAQKAFNKELMEINLLSIGTGTVVALSIMVFSGVIEWTPTQMVPITGMVASNSMTAINVVYRSLYTQFKDRRQQVLEKIALGADPKQASKSILRDSIQTGMAPPIERTKTVGLVSLPGMMSGLIFTGIDPAQAVRYQIVVMFMLISVAAISSFIASYMVYRSFFNDNGQLTI